jgi:hypothetical protein
MPRIVIDPSPPECTIGLDESLEAYMDHPELSHLPPEAERPRATALRSGPAARLRVRVGDTDYPIRACDATGFEIALDVAPKLRGLVEIYDGARMVRSALIVAGVPDGEVMRYDFKRATAFRRTAPLDYVDPATRPRDDVAAT